MGDLGVLTDQGISSSEQHDSMLSEAVGDGELAKRVLIQSFGRSFNGFAAYLLPQEANKLSKMSSVVSVFESRRRNTTTTRSWDFMGMSLRHTRRNPTVESNTIVALLDTGIYVDARSFNDEGFGPPPPKWKGKCDHGPNFTGCNNKVIGARYYNLDPDGDYMYPSPVDTDGHGSHTASTAAGVAVEGASLYGIAKGTAHGAVPGARIAMYKVCGEFNCADANILAAFDDAIADGADVISVSIGGTATDFFDDSIAIGAFHAMKKGILTVCAAGNSGPSSYTVENPAPWILTVAASSIDRQFRTPAKLGNGLQFAGLSSINTISPNKNMYPLTSGALAANNSSEPYLNASACDEDSLDPRKVKGKIVLCFGSSDRTIFLLGGQGLINALDDVNDNIAFTTIFPEITIGSKTGQQILNYINSSKQKAIGVINKTITVETKAPVVASFSGRGPQTVVPNILKPDITAPGLDILAAYSKLTSITDEDDDKRRYDFNIISGTSMSTPHVGGAAAYVKTFHPDWSEAAVRSALMTTATPIVENGVESSPLNSGSGLLNPKKAVHPGLVYDLTIISYIRYLCKEGYNSTTLALLFCDKRKLNCSDYPPARGADGLNYPSMHLQLQRREINYTAVFHRVVTQVGYGVSTYKATVRAPKGMSIQVIPNQLAFTKMHEKMNFKVVVRGKIQRDEATSLHASLEWNDGKHNVRSPIVVYKQ
ncbi:hypothetical protein Dimus_007026 [Dionaea muscipula]